MKDTVKSRVKVARLAIGLTQIEAAERLGITQGSYSSIENGNGLVSDKNIIKIVKAFDINESWLRTGEGAMSKTSVDTEILDICQELSPLSREYVLQLARDLLEKEKRFNQEH